MRHNKKFNHLSRKANHRAAMLSNMACSLIIPIKTAMAKEGYVKEIFRLPLCSLEKEEHRNSLYSIIDRMKEDIREGRI